MACQTTIMTENNKMAKNSYTNLDLLDQKYDEIDANLEELTQKLATFKIQENSELSNFNFGPATKIFPALQNLTYQVLHLINLEKYENFKISTQIYSENFAQNVSKEFGDPTSKYQDKFLAKIFKVGNFSLNLLVLKACLSFFTSGNRTDSSNFSTNPVNASFVQKIYENFKNLDRVQLTSENWTQLYQISIQFLTCPQEAKFTQTCLLPLLNSGILETCEPKFYDLVLSNLSDSQDLVRAFIQLPNKMHLHWIGWEIFYLNNF